ncbi:polyhydroxyalkanoate synthesis regulator DNA-binding domain-containing protein [Fontivita pretiosa]|uniref:polyhydroxyalkanoate synthesis regulator DNA-binding domain-containing protein n=1 Tax=Fontivita pretiosa TaxID=2989684 RepID=UPI003D17CCC0
MLSPQSASTSTPPKQLKINKYPNRRYYDTTRSRHVTLEQIYSLIRDGYEVQVTDSRTRQDITARVLTQILIDLDPQKLRVFPLAMLHRLLRSNPERVNDFIAKQLSQPLNAFLQPQPDSRPDSTDERR